MFADSYTGYLRITEASFCMDECSMYYLESESGDYIVNVSLNEFDPLLYLDRFVALEGEEIWCVECGAVQISQISLSAECKYPVACFVDPCDVAQDCQLNTPVECVSNYCGGCHADFYDPNGNLVDCYSEPVFSCDDLGNIFFGMCDMFLGYAVVDEICNGVSGCGWTSNGVDYSDAFFDSFNECENACSNEPYLCEDIEYDYDQLHSDSEYVTCEYDNDCIAVWGHCDVGLGGCHYSVNEDNYPEDQINGLVDMWIEGDCMQWVCDCSSPPYAQCINETCTSAYCMSDNPAGCDQTGCEEGYECVNDPNYCVGSSCYCDGFYGQWYCTEDCGGGTCVILGDINYDGALNVVDVVSIVNIILQTSYNIVADINQDNSLNVVDIVILVDLIIGEL